MASYDYNSIKSAQIADWVKIFNRTSAIPLERTQLFNSYSDALKYAAGDGTDERELGKTSYIGQILTVYENDTTKVYVINASRTLTEITNQSPSSNTWATKEYVDTTVAGAVTGLFKFKGSDTGAAINAIQDAKPGDVWNVTDEITLKVDGTNIVYPQGTNVVWVDITYVLDNEGKPTTKVDVPAHWDAFGGLCDLSGYLTKPTYTDNDVNKVLTVVNEEGKLTHKWKSLPDSAIYWEDIP